MERLFVGSAICKMGDKGDIALPETFRGIIASRDASEHLYIGLHEHMNCLIVYDDVILQERIERFDRGHVTEEGAEPAAELERLCQNFGFAAPARLGGEGSPSNVSGIDERSGETRDVLIVGMGHYFEVWDLDYVLNHGRRDLQQLATLHLDLIHAKPKGAAREISLQSVGARRGIDVARESGLPVQPLPSLRPRHDPVDGVRRG